MSEQQTCGKGLAARAALPAKLAELTNAMAEILRFHQRSLPQNEPNAVTELRTYAQLEENYRAIEALLHATASAMSEARDLPAAPHDVSVLASRENALIFGRFVERERELAALLEQSIDRDRATLEQMTR